LVNYFLKPVRYPDDHEAFRSNAQSNWRLGRLTNVCLDLNILARIGGALSDPSLDEKHGLRELRQELSLPGLILNPGFAYREMDPQKLDDNREAFEQFLSGLSPAYRDMPDATWSPELSWSFGQADDAPRSFWALPDAKRDYLIGFYIAQLLLRIGRKSLGEPQNQFKSYLEDGYRLTGQFLPLEARIAQFAFFDRSRTPVGAWSKFCGDIRDNFTKSAGTLPKLQWAVLNQVLDTVLLRSAQVLHHRSLLESDVWIVTQDRGLASFANTFCYSPDHRSEAGLYSAFMWLSPFPEMDTDPYWRETDAIIDQFANLPRRTYELPHLESVARQIEVQLKQQLSG
jgi:hypothetical protein